MHALPTSPSFAPQQRFVIDDESKIGEARRAAQTLASLELDEQVAGRVAIVATELANNLWRHAGGGELLLQSLGMNGATVLELLAVDRGPGMHDVSICMRDGFSTRGTAGTGLGAVRRLADDFDIDSMPGEGTVVMARFGDGLAARFGAVCVALHGEVVCGDAWHVVGDGERAAVMVVDGLGHGPFAAEAAQAGIAAFAASPWDEPLQLMQRAGMAMARTRGGAAACARLEADRASYSGIGNISGTLVSPGKSQGLVSHAGTVGMQGRRAQQFEHQRSPGDLLVMHSDGISARWSYKDRAGFFALHPAVIAAVIWRDHGRERDDATVVVVA